MLHITQHPGPIARRAAESAQLLRSGALGARLVNLARLAAAAHMAQSAQQLVRPAAQAPTDAPTTTGGLAS